MSQKIERASVTTTLALGGVRAPVSLFKAFSEPSEAKWDTAGPAGGALHFALRLPEGEEVSEGEEVTQPEPEPKAADPLTPDGEVADAMERAFAEEEEEAPRRMLREEGTDAWVEPEEVRRGVRREDDSFVDLTEALDGIRERTQLPEMRIVSFIHRGVVPRFRIKGSYYLAAEDEGSAKVLRLLDLAMRRTDRRAVVKLTKRTRQALGVLTYHGESQALVLMELEWAGHVREPSERVLTYQTAEVTDGELDAAVRLVRALSASRESLDVLEDDAEKLTRELLTSVERGEAFTLPEPSEATGDTVEDALRGATPAG